MNPKLEMKKFIHWNDQEAKQKLIEKGHIKPLPSSCRHWFHEPDECAYCAYKVGGVLYALKIWLELKFR